MNDWVLLAEDDPEMRRMVAEMLRRDRYVVIEVADGAELLAQLKHSLFFNPEGRLPGLVISDVRMPGWTGLDVLAELRRMDSGLPVLLITAFGDPALHREAQRLGAVVLDKPFELARLRAIVRQVLPRS